MRTTSFSIIDYLPDSVREMPKRRAAELIGICVLTGVGAASLALLTWSVEDPSLNHATSTPIHNLLGAPGAIFADIAMQSMGLSCIVALTPPAFWGWTLMTRRRLERARLRVALWLIGSIAAAGLAGFLPAPTHWPLPSGLGGVLGDAVLWLPRYFFGGSTSAMALAGLALSGLAILTLTASAGFGLMQTPSLDEPEAGAKVAAKRRLDDPADNEDDDSDGEPGLGLVSLGAAIHAILTVKSALRRLFAARKRDRAPAGAPPRAPWLDPDKRGLAVNEDESYAPRPSRLEPFFGGGAGRGTAVSQESADSAAAAPMV
jgi:S-DNA-T family DNA segregation ATPase FtsK/SpoIIIE